MKVTIHKLFEYLLETTTAAPEAVLGLSLARPPLLGEFLADLDPGLPLDWNGVSFRGLPALRAHVIARAGLTGVCDAEDVLITAGTAEANYLVMRQLLRPGDEVVTESPGWPQVGVMCRAMGIGLHEVARDENRDWALDLDALEAAVGPRTRLIFLTNPNNPTGALLTGAELLRVCAIADRVGAYLLVDEVYAGLEWGAPRAPSIAGLYHRGITTGSVSKALGLQGLRTGWLICRDRDLVMDAVILRENSSEIMNIMGEVIAEVAMREHRYVAGIERARADGAANLAVLQAFIAGQPRLSWVPPAAGLIGLARVEGIEGEALARRLLEPPYRTFLLPGSAYGCPSHIRLGVGGGAEVRLGEGLARLGALLAVE